MRKVRYKLNGRFVTLRELRRRPRIGGDGTPMIGDGYKKGLVSVGLGCTKKQVPEFNRQLQEKNITGARYLPSGDLKFESRQARNAVLRLRNYRDNDAGYGDFAGNS